MFSSQPWENNRAAIWFEDLIRNSDLTNKIKDELAIKVTSADQADRARAAIFIIINLCRDSIWPKSAVKDLCALASQRMKEIIAMEDDAKSARILRLELKILQMRADGTSYQEQDEQYCKLLKLRTDAAKPSSSASVQVEQVKTESLYRKAQDPETMRLEKQCFDVDLTSVKRLFLPQKTGYRVAQYWQSKDGCELFSIEGRLGKVHDVFASGCSDHKGVVSETQRSLGLCAQEGYTDPPSRTAQIQLKMRNGDLSSFDDFRKTVMSLLFRSCNLISMVHSPNNLTLVCEVFDERLAKKVLNERFGHDAVID